MNATPSTSPIKIRLDVWLWRARFYKSRAMSARTIRLGRIRILRAGQTLRITKPHTAVQLGDKLTFMRSSELFHIEILSIGYRRGPACEAQALYTHLEHRETPGQGRALTA